MQGMKYIHRPHPIGLKNSLFDGWFIDGGRDEEGLIIELILSP
jgi:hypothetical protein